jgi:acetyl esterase
MLDAFASAGPAPAGLSPAELRARANESMVQGIIALGNPAKDVASIVNHVVPVSGGEIIVRVYTPHAPAPRPAHLYLHGGGFFMGTAEHFDANCQDTAEDAGCVVASVDYRLAPEYKFPIPAEDCYAALRWLVDHAADLGVDASRVSVGGGSAGGNLAAVVALMARDRGGPPLVFQLLEIPVTDLTMSYPSVIENGTGYMLTQDSMRAYVDYYIRDEGDAKHPYASPIFAEDLTGLPPALVMTAECDPLRDEGEAYGERLRDAGVPVTIRRWDGQIHGSQHMAKLLPEEASEYHEMVVGALRKAYGS